ncbi:MAG: hypothetical protein M3Y59_18875 [Myxococcota bacterium]|nr:hypothetical protein [Myxococcota bacterium]
MIPVSPQPEPASFAKDVRTPGTKWLIAKGLHSSAPLRPKTKAPPHWRECLKDLHRSYGGVCAYLAIYLERCTGGVSVDHFVAKSKRGDQTYEWANYRLACTTMNARKRDFSSVLDPFTLAPGTFRLELVTGRIYADPSLSGPQKTSAEVTIKRLGLDDAGNREMRARRFTEYLELRGTAPTTALREQLRRYCPFIHSEASRQGLL